MYRDNVHRPSLISNVAIARAHETESISGAKALPRYDNASVGERVDKASLKSTMEFV